MGLKPLFSTFLCQGEIEIIVIRDMGDQYTNHVFTSKGTLVVYSNPNLELTLRCSTIPRSALDEQSKFLVGSLLTQLT